MTPFRRRSVPHRAAAGPARRRAPASGRASLAGLAGLVGLIVLAVSIVLPAVGPRVGSTAGADPAVPFTATATPTDGVHDGQSVTINVKATGTNVVYQGRAAECRAGVTYQDSAPGAALWNPDANPNGPNCPLAKISSSADTAVVDSSMINGASSPDGESMSLRVGVGPITWTDIDGVDRSLTCDPSNPCELVVELLTGPRDGSSPTVWIPFTKTLTFVSNDPLASCGGAANGALSTGASDALVDAWSAWTLDQCKQPGQTGAATEASFVGEGQAVQQFASGLLDVAYTGAGYDKDVGLVPDGTVPGGPRPAVAVPIGIGAEVLGVGNGYGGLGKKVPFGTIELTAGDLASIVGSGSFTSLDEQNSIAARNPHLSPFFFAPSSDLQVGVPSTASSSTWFLSNYLTRTAPGSWKVPPIGAAGPDVNKPRGIFDDFGTTTPDFTLLTTYTGRPALEKVLFGIVSNTNLLGGVFVVSDLTTARAESLAPAALETQPGSPFVAPTEASMDAAVADMQPDAQGLLQPPAQPTDPNAYPLTYVEYALVPAQPLVDATCAPRTASQAELTTWLHYLTGAGQKVLPDGLEPLTPALAAQASTAMAHVGATPNTCTPPAGVGGDGGGASGSGSGALADGLSGLDGSSDGTGSGSSSSAAAGTAGQTRTIASKVAIPGFGGDQAASLIETLLALAAIAALVTMAARFSSRATAPASESGESGSGAESGAGGEPGDDRGGP